MFKVYIRNLPRLLAKFSIEMYQFNLTILIHPFTQLIYSFHLLVSKYRKLFQTVNTPIRVKYTCYDVGRKTTFLYFVAINQLLFFSNCWEVDGVHEIPTEFRASHKNINLEFKILDVTRKKPVLFHRWTISITFFLHLFYRQTTRNQILFAKFSFLFHFRYRLQV